MAKGMVSIMVWAKRAPCGLFGYQWATQRTLDILITGWNGLSLIYYSQVSLPFSYFLFVTNLQKGSFLSIAPWLAAWKGSTLCEMEGSITWLSSSCTSFKISALINMPVFFTEWGSRQPPCFSLLGWHCANKMFEIRQVFFILSRIWKKSQILVYEHINISPFPKYTSVKWLQ